MMGHSRKIAKRNSLLVVLVLVITIACSSPLDLFGPLPTPTTPPTQVPTQTLVVAQPTVMARQSVEMSVSSESLNVRSLPMIIGQVIDVLSSGDAIFVFTDGCTDNEDGHWCEVDYMKGDVRINGFVDTQYLILK